MAKIKFVVIGAGHIGKRHINHIIHHPECELVAVIDNNSGKLNSFDVPTFDSIQSFSESTIKADVLNICTPNGLHTIHALAGLNANLHVVIEKPLALNTKNAEEVIHTALQRSKKVFCVMQNRYSPPSQWLKSIIDQNLLGKIYQVQVNCFWNRNEQYYAQSDWHGTLALDGGPMFTQFSHFVDLIFWLFGDWTNIEARFHNHRLGNAIEFEDGGNVYFDLKNNAKGSFNYSIACHQQNFESSVTIIAEKGTIKVGGQYMDKIETCTIENYEIPTLEATLPPNDYGHYKGSAANHHFVIQNIVNVINGKSTIDTNAMEGLKVVDILERVYQKR